MSSDQERQITPSNRGVFRELSLRLRLILRLLGDRRVNFLLKLLPIAALIYLIVPDLAPGPIDDALILWLGGYLFIELCPPAVVAEHMRALTSVIEGEWREVNDNPADDNFDSGNRLPD
jgi:hypothetical protein